MRHLIMQNSFVQELMELNMTLSGFFPLNFIEKIYSRKITLDKAIEKQVELKELINKLNGSDPKI